MRDAVGHGPPLCSPHRWPGKNSLECTSYCRRRAPDATRICRRKDSGRIFTAAVKKSRTVHRRHRIVADMGESGRLRRVPCTFVLHVARPCGLELRSFAESARKARWPPRALDRMRHASLQLASLASPQSRNPCRSGSDIRSSVQIHRPSARAGAAHLWRQESLICVARAGEGP